MYSLLSTCHPICTEGYSYKGTEPLLAGLPISLRRSPPTGSQNVKILFHFEFRLGRRLLAKSVFSVVVFLMVRWREQEWANSFSENHIIGVDYQPTKRAMHGLGQHLRYYHERVRTKNRQFRRQFFTTCSRKTNDFLLLRHIFSLASDGLCACQASQMDNSASNEGIQQVACGTGKKKKLGKSKNEDKLGCFRKPFTERERREREM